MTAPVPAELQAELPETPLIERAVALLGAAADPTRLRLLIALRSGECSVSTLAELTGHTISAVSHQLRILRLLNAVRARKSGRTVYYTLADDHIRQLLALVLEHALETPAGEPHG